MKEYKNTVQTIQNTTNTSTHTTKTPTQLSKQTCKCCLRANVEFLNAEHDAI